MLRPYDNKFNSSYQPIYGKFANIHTFTSFTIKNPPFMLENKPFVPWILWATYIHIAGQICINS